MEEMVKFAPRREKIFGTTLSLITDEPSVDVSAVIKSDTLTQSGNVRRWWPSEAFGRRKSLEQLIWAPACQLEFRTKNPQSLGVTRVHVMWHWPVSRYRIFPYLIHFDHKPIQLLDRIYVTRLTLSFRISCPSRSDWTSPFGQTTFCRITAICL